MIYEQVIFEIEEDIAIIRMNRPNKKSAFSPTMSREILEIVTHIKNTPEIRGVLLTSQNLLLRQPFSFCNPMRIF